MSGDPPSRGDDGVTVWPDLPSPPLYSSDDLRSPSILTGDGGDNSPQPQPQPQPPTQQQREASPEPIAAARAPPPPRSVFVDMSLRGGDGVGSAAAPARGGREEPVGRARARLPALSLKGAAAAARGVAGAEDARLQLALLARRCGHLERRVRRRALRLQACFARQRRAARDGMQRPQMRLRLGLEPAAADGDGDSAAAGRSRLRIRAQLSLDGGRVLRAGAAVSSISASFCYVARSGDASRVGMRWEAATAEAEEEEATGALRSVIDFSSGPVFEAGTGFPELIELRVVPAVAAAPEDRLVHLDVRSPELRRILFSAYGLDAVGEPYDASTREEVNRAVLAYASDRTVFERMRHEEPRVMPLDPLLQREVGAGRATPADLLARMAAKMVAPAPFVVEVTRDQRLLEVSLPWLRSDAEAAGHPEAVARVALREAAEGIRRVRADADAQLDALHPALKRRRLLGCLGGGSGGDDGDGGEAAGAAVRGFVAQQHREMDALTRPDAAASKDAQLTGGAFWATDVGLDALRRMEAEAEQHVLADMFSK